MSNNRITNRSSQIRTATVRAFSLGIITGSFITAGAILLAAPAKADGYLDDSEADYVNQWHAAICQVIDDPDYHNFEGVIGVTKAVAHDGYTLDNAIDIVNASVSEWCPRNWPLLVALGKAARGEATA